MKEMLYVAAGGALGSVLRYLIAKTNPNASYWATLSTNVVGSFIIGIAFAYVIKHPENKWFAPLLMTGFCGGFTTFSTFSLEVLKQLQAQQFYTALLYLLLSLGLSITAVYVGFLSGKYV